MNQHEDYSFTTHAHDSGGDNIDYAITAVLMTSAGFAFTFQHTGSVEGTVAGLPVGTPRRDDDFTSPTVNNPLISAHWSEIVGGGTFLARIDGVDSTVGSLTDLLGIMVKAAATQLGQDAAKGIEKLL